jgi:hypothetical protein
LQTAHEGLRPQHDTLHARRTHLVYCSADCRPGQPCSSKYSSITLCTVKCTKHTKSGKTSPSSFKCFSVQYSLPGRN